MTEEARKHRDLLSHCPRDATSCNWREGYDVARGGVEDFKEEKAEVRLPAQIIGRKSFGSQGSGRKRQNGRKAKGERRRTGHSKKRDIRKRGKLP